MDVDHVGEFADGGTFAHQDTDLLDNVGSVSAIGMTTENRTILRSTEEF